MCARDIGTTCGKGLWRGLTFTLILGLAASGGAALIIEDFEDDNIPGAPGFASSVFNHNILGPNSFLTAPFFLPPSPAHALFLGALTTDHITFSLNPGEWVSSAGVWLTGTGGGGAGVTFLGTNGNLSFATATQDQFVYVAVSPLDNLGPIIGILLGDPIPPGFGPEGMYDNVTIDVVPEPTSAGLVTVALVAAGLRRRRAASGATAC